MLEPQKPQKKDVIIWIQIAIRELEVDNMSFFRVIQRHYGDLEVTGQDFENEVDEEDFKDEDHELIEERELEDNEFTL